MRPYRGLTKEGNKWVYGWYLHRHESDWDGHDKYIHQIHTKEWNEFIEVIPETVGQSTGRKDKNKTDLYQDDIVRKHHKNYRVDWNVKGFWELQRSGDWWLALHKIDSEKLERIGNIHQNPKLLEQDNG